MSTNDKISKFLELTLKITKITGRYQLSLQRVLRTLSWLDYRQVVQVQKKLAGSDRGPGQPAAAGFLSQNPHSLQGKCPGMKSKRRL